MHIELLLGDNFESSKSKDSCFPILEQHKVPNCLGLGSEIDE